MHRPNTIGRWLDRRPLTSIALYMTLVALVGFALVFARAADAQNAMTLDVDLSNPLAPVATWTATPAAGVTCAASGSWSGAKAASGTETLDAIRASSLWALQCDWPDETQATLTWVNPTTNDNGSAYTNPGVTRLAWTSGSNLGTFDCLRPTSPPAGVSTTDRPAGQTMHTITGLTAGSWSFRAFAVNTLGLCSAASNTAAKTLQPASSLSDSFSVTVPGAPQLGAE